MRIPVQSTKAVGKTKLPVHPLASGRANAGVAPQVVRPSVDIGCILATAAGCLPVCITGNIPACIACAGPGILKCL